MSLFFAFVTKYVTISYFSENVKVLFFMSSPFTAYGSLKLR